MVGVSTLAAGLATAALLTVNVHAQDQTCESYGIDFQDGGSYFQNISSMDPFTFVSVFEGCQPDIAQNLLVDPNGDEYQCSDTNLTPDDTNQMSTCPLDKDQMFSGDWSVVVISNNGDSGEPIAYERDFYLTVGLPVTSTFTPTVTLSSTLTPIVNTTTTVPNLISATVNATVTDAAHTKHPTTTVTPHKVVVKTTKTMATIKETAYLVVPVIKEHIHTATCRLPKRQQHPDPKCSITPTLISAAALSTSSSNKKAKKFRGGKRVVDREVSLDREQRIAERKARLLHKRSPDNATVTVTDTNTDDYVTTTFVSTAPASTLVITTATNTTTTLTNTFTTFSGKTTLPRVTVTAPTPTSTHTKYTIATTTVKTKTLKETIKITATWVDPIQSIICDAKGGRMV
ncbi:hypothetical protein MBLNU457_6682t1 [Dothideomycetes sp. NU457]